MRSLYTGSNFRPILRLKEAEVEWLGLFAYIQVLKRKQSRYKELLSLLKFKLLNHKITGSVSSELSYAVDRSRSSIMWKIKYQKILRGVYISSEISLPSVFTSPFSCIINSPSNVRFVMLFCNAIEFVCFCTDLQTKLWITFSEKSEIHRIWIQVGFTSVTNVIEFLCLAGGNFIYSVVYSFQLGLAWLWIENRAGESTAD